MTEHPVYRALATRARHAARMIPLLTAETTDRPDLQLMAEADLDHMAEAIGHLNAPLGQANDRG